MFTTNAKSVRMEDPPRQFIHIRLEPQSYEIKIDPPRPSEATSGMSPQQVLQQTIIEKLRDVAVTAAYLVLHSGLEAAFGAPLDRKDTDHMIQWYVDEQAKRLAEANEAVIERNKLIDEQRIQIETLERVLRR